MLNPGQYTLGDFSIGAAGAQEGTAITDLDGMTAATLQLRFVYGSGGTSVKAYLQTSLDGGTTWADVACVVFNTANENRIVNLSGLTPKTTSYEPTDAALADDTCVDGILGDRLRLKVVSAGTYAGQTLLSGRVVAR